MSRHDTTDFDRARDEMMSQIHRCGVLKAAPDQQTDWLKDTADYLKTEYPSLSDQEVEQLQEIGRLFCQPAIPHGRGKTDLTRDDWSDSDSQVSEESQDAQDSQDSQDVAATQ